ncbi:hypothetical protein GV794_24250 [Nocardia cyriacigeorgica]|uniref:Uncharacterized protein n=1 Tax=Nocardia cyriacigeorgica TaxID=135487 RepID=A0A6P1DBQ7_9NOCA|nr:hypothetical protein [Nocardia cyriacigeorgica]NEW39696.1 hypothetical protein [Nocardia cyriacigeorgica]NEW46250.1 hypothetical protein [Nocardia cyriacigeorgica]NEW50186.1 hypothetical protein [Nocardia cyriacigeorgica]NEW58726.1 hypothetical protein [Nocardia cyriacigeorgica]
MTFLVTLFVIVTFGLLGYYYAPRRSEDGWDVDRLRPRDPVNNLPLSHYDEQRLFRDIAAVYAHREETGRGRDVEEPGRRRRRANPRA